MFSTFTRSKILRIPWLAYKVVADDLGGEKVISLSAVFWRMRILWVTELSLNPHNWQAYLAWDIKIAWKTLSSILKGT